METRLLIAYFLIGLLLAAALWLLRRIVVKGREHRRLMRGFRHFRHYKQAPRRKNGDPLTPA